MSRSADLRDSSWCLRLKVGVVSGGERPRPRRSCFRVRGRGVVRGFVVGSVGEVEEERPRASPFLLDGGCVSRDGEGFLTGVGDLLVTHFREQLESFIGFGYVRSETFFSRFSF